TAGLPAFARIVLEKVPDQAILHQLTRPLLEDVHLQPSDHQYGHTPPVATISKLLYRGRFCSNSRRSSSAYNCASAWRPGACDMNGLFGRRNFFGTLQRVM